jgi:hypothetical protein
MAEKKDEQTVPEFVFISLGMYQFHISKANKNDILEVTTFQERLLPRYNILPVQ